MSVPDQYIARAGFSYSIKKLMVSASLREECIPVNDLIGGSNGFRRPGRILTAEPGATYNLRVNLFAYVPVALSRNRTQSVPDKITTALTGKYTQGDAAFANYSVNIGAAFKFYKSLQLFSRYK